MKLLPKAIALWLTYNFGTFLIKIRNRTPKILIYPDSRLKRIAKPVDFEKMSLAERTKIVRKMGMALNKTTYGMKLGIAAPQIGINYRVMIVRGNVMFNPEWHPSAAPAVDMQEACYSVPGKLFRVPRAQYGWAKWTNIDGKPMEDRIKDIAAVVFQHELSHLDGKCCPDLGVEIEQKTPAKV